NAFLWHIHCCRLASSFHPTHARIVGGCAVKSGDALLYLFFTAARIATSLARPGTGGSWWKGENAMMHTKPGLWVRCCISLAGLCPPTPPFGPIALPADACSYTP